MAGGPQGAAPHYFLEGGIGEDGHVVAEGEEEDAALAPGVPEGHYVGLIAVGVVRLEQVVRAGRVVLQVVEFVGHGELLQAPGEWVVGIRDGDGEVHVRAMAVEEGVEHVVVALAVAEGGGGGVQAEEAISPAHEVEQAVLLGRGEGADIGVEECGAVRGQAVFQDGVVPGEVGFHFAGV